MSYIDDVTDTEEAALGLQELYDYVADQAAPAKENHVLNCIERLLASLLNMPEGRDAPGNPLPQAKRTYYLYADEGVIAESEQAIEATADAAGNVSSTAAQAPQITTQYIPQPNSLFTTAYLAVKTKVASGSNAGQSAYGYYHHDHLGTPIRITDKTGSVVWSADTNAFGGAQVNTAQSSIKNNLRLPGQYLDEETGLYYNWNRYYDAQTGRYTSEDPIGLAGGLNRYAYVEGSPLSMTDPMGLMGGGGNHAAPNGDGCTPGSAGLQNKSVAYLGPVEVNYTTKVGGSSSLYVGVRAPGLGIGNFTEGYATAGSMAGPTIKASGGVGLGVYFQASVAVSIGNGSTGGGGSASGGFGGRTDRFYGIAPPSPGGGWTFPVNSGSGSGSCTCAAR